MQETILSFEPNNITKDDVGVPPPFVLVGMTRVQPNSRRVTPTRCYDNNSDTKSITRAASVIDVRVFINWFVKVMIASLSTTTVVLENPSTKQQPQTLCLQLRKKKKKVSWKEGTVDNEFMQKKSSKKCCIFHKEKPFDEDDSDEEDHHHHHDQDHESDGCNGASTSN
ncbi:hypothetical protein ACFE04_028310 [Oxalis oulophora]